MNDTLELEIADIASLPTVQLDDIVDGEFEELPEEPKKHSRWFLVPIAIALLVIGGSIGSYLYPLFFGKETITLYPSTITLSKNVTFTNIPFRLLAKVNESQSKTVQTTGIVQQPASAASGLLTFYNAALVAQTIEAGTMIYAGTVKVVTDATITVPAGQLATKGIASVQGHTLSTGKMSNIGTGATYGECCKDNVLVTNSAFYGGTDATTYHTAKPEDIAGVASSLKTLLDAKVQKDIIAQVHSDETLLPQQCSATTVSNVQPGTAAEAVTISEVETCTAKTYKASDLQQKSNVYLTAQAQKMYGSIYSSRDIQVSINSVEENKIAVSVSGDFSYQMSLADQIKLKKLLAGKSKTDAHIIIANMQGIDKAQIEGLDTLPDVQRIDIEIAQ